MTKISKQGIIKFPQFIHEVAEIIGKMRNDISINAIPENPIFSNERKRQGNVLGIKGEMIFMGHLSANGYNYDYSALLSDTPISKADITCNGKGVDIKTIRTDVWDLLVNVKSHGKDKGITSYVFIQIESKDTARYWIFNHSTVSKWDIKKCGVSDAYYLPLEKIKKHEPIRTD